MFKKSSSRYAAPLLGALLLASGNAMAQDYNDSPLSSDAGGSVPLNDLRYSYGELRYVDIETSVFDAEADGFKLGGSYRLTEEYFVFGSFTNLDANFSRVGGDASELKLGGGYIYPLNNTVDINSTVALVREDVDAGPFDDDDIGIQLTGGARAMVTDLLEVRGNFVFQDVVNRDIYLEIAADYYFTDNLIGGISVEFAGDNDVLTFGARFYFGS